MGGTRVGTRCVRLSLALFFSAYAVSTCLAASSPPLGLSPASPHHHDTDVEGPSPSHLFLFSSQKHVSAHSLMEGREELTSVGGGAKRKKLIRVDEPHSLPTVQIPPREDRNGSLWGGNTETPQEVDHSSSLSSSISFLQRERRREEKKNKKSYRNVDVRKQDFIAYSDLKPPGLPSVSKEKLKSIVKSTRATEADERDLSLVHDPEVLLTVNQDLLPIIKMAALLCLNARQELGRTEYRSLENVEVESGVTQGVDQSPVRQWIDKRTGKAVDVEEVRMTLPNGTYTLNPVRVIRRPESDEAFEERKQELFRDLQWRLRKVQMELDSDNFRLSRKVRLITELMMSKSIADDSREEQIAAVVFRRSPKDPRQSWLDAASVSDTAKPARPGLVPAAITKVQERAESDEALITQRRELLLLKALQKKTADETQDQNQDGEGGAAKKQDKGGSGTTFATVQQREQKLAEQQKEVEELDKNYLKDLGLLPSSDSNQNNRDRQSDGKTATSTSEVGQTPLSPMGSLYYPMFHYSGTWLGLPKELRRENELIDSTEREGTRLVEDWGFMNGLLRILKEDATREIAKRAHADREERGSNIVQGAIWSWRRMEAAKTLFTRKAKEIVELLYDNGYSGMRPQHREFLIIGFGGFGFVSDVGVSRQAFREAERNSDHIILGEIKKSAGLCLRARLPVAIFRDEVHSALETLSGAVQAAKIKSETAKEAARKKEARDVLKIHRIVNTAVFGVES